MVAVMVLPFAVWGLGVLASWVVRWAREKSALRGIPEMTDGWANLMADAGKKLRRDEREEWQA